MEIITDIESILLVPVHIVEKQALYIDINNEYYFDAYDVKKDNLVFFQDYSQKRFIDIVENEICFVDESDIQLVDVKVIKNCGPFVGWIKNKKLYLAEPIINIGYEKIKFGLNFGSTWHKDKCGLFGIANELLYFMKWKSHES